MGSRLLTDQKRLSPIFNTLQKNSAMFIETPGIEKSAAAAVAGQAGLPYLAADLQIDANAADLSIQKQLTELEKIAQERGYAIGIAEPYPMTVNALKAWVNGLEKKGITLAPLSTVWKNKPRHDETAPPSQEQLQQP